MDFAIIFSMRPKASDNESPFRRLFLRGIGCFFFGFGEVLEVPGRFSSLTLALKLIKVLMDGEINVNKTKLWYLRVNLFLDSVRFRRRAAGEQSVFHSVFTTCIKHEDITVRAIRVDKIDHICL